jgi:hypothetical protein
MQHHSFKTMNDAKEWSNQQLSIAIDKEEGR